QVSDALGDSPWYLRLLRDDTMVARRMARVLAASRYATDLLLRQPEMVAILGEDAQLAARPAPALRAEAVAAVRRHASPPDAVAEDLRALLARPAPDPPLLIDPGLRPEGKQGPLARTLASYRAYYERWSVPWEAQALLRAEPVVGDRPLGARFTALADEFRYPAGGIGDDFAREIRRIKAGVEAERMPRG